MPQKKKKDENYGLLAVLLLGGAVALLKAGKKGEDYFSKHWTLEDFTRSDVATQYGIAEQFTPGVQERNNGQLFATHILDPIVDCLGGKPRINSWFRSKALNDKLIALGYSASPTSEHMEGYTTDLHWEVDGENLTANIVKCVLEQNLPYRQMIIEEGTWARPAWVHISWNKDNRPQQILRYTKNGGYSNVSRSKAENIYLV